MALPSDDEMDDTLSAEAIATNVLSLDSIGCYKLGKKVGEGELPRPLLPPRPRKKDHMAPKRRGNTTYF